ncbi:SGNH/GDSL hydrolase family protein [Chryseobacterium phage MA9V-2]|nr:SGNH/GDSL hydrolase family protein [Chryseobacterium phage MA9V-2]
MANEFKRLLPSQLGGATEKVKAKIIVTEGDVLKVLNQEDMPGINLETSFNPADDTKGAVMKATSEYIDTKVLIQNTLFTNALVETSEKQVTATGTIGNSTVTSVHGISASLGIVAEPFDKVNIHFAQKIETPVTEIEIRLFEGKAAGGRLIKKKRQVIPASTTVQALATINFDLAIDYSNDMWVQILANNPFAYKRVSPAVLRTAAAGYGTPYITTVNDLSGTAFGTAQGFIDISLEFNKLEYAIVATDEGKNVIMSPLTESIVTDITGDYTPANSYIDANGAVINSGNWRTTELIHDVAGLTLGYTGATNQSTAAVGMVGYKADNSVQVLIGNSDHSLEPIKVIVPADIVAIRACGYSATPPVVTLTGPKIIEKLLPTTKATEKIKIDKVWHCVGHSIWAQDGVLYSGTDTMAVGIQTLIKKIFKFNGYNKYCYSGRSLGATLPTGDTASITNYFNTWTDTSDGFWSIDTITNDFKRNIPIGTIDDYKNATGILTYYGALRAFNDKVQSLTPGAVIFCSNAFRRNNGGYTSTSTNTAGHTLLDYEIAIMTIAALNGWRYIDQFRQSEITDETLSITTGDGLHPNNFGYTLAVKQWIRNFWIYASER